MCFAEFWLELRIPARGNYDTQSVTAPSVPRQQVHARAFSSQRQPTSRWSMNPASFASTAHNLAGRPEQCAENHGTINLEQESGPADESHLCYRGAADVFESQIERYSAVKMSAGLRFAPSANWLR